MERQKYTSRLVLTIGILLLVMQSGFSQSAYQDSIYKAYSRGKMDKWYHIMHDCEENVDSNNTEKQIELLSYYYGYIGWLINAKKYDTARHYINKSDHIVDAILDESPNHATVLAYKGAIIGFRIGLSNLKAIYLGRKSIKYIDRSLELDSENIQGNIEKGNSLYYCPSIFGGDKEEAITYYVKAVKRFEEEGLVHNNWLYINTMTVLGQAYEATDQIQLAKVCYEKIMRIFPNFMWVEDELYPDMLKRHKL